jgi:hypothetical protein
MAIDQMGVPGAEPNRPEPRRNEAADAWMAVATEMMECSMRAMARSMEIMTAASGPMPMDQRLEAQRKGMLTAFDAGVKDIQQLWTMAADAAGASVKLTVPAQGRPTGSAGAGLSS